MSYYNLVIPDHLTGPLKVVAVSTTLQQPSGCSALLLQTGLATQGSENPFPPPPPHALPGVEGLLPSVFALVQTLQYR